MGDTYIELTYWQVALAASLVLINGAISLALRLDLERPLLVASVRMTVQLLLIGFVLHWIFALHRWQAVVALALLMTLIASAAAVGRTEHRHRGIWISSFVSIWASSWLVTGLALVVIVQVQPWYRPQYAIPLLGMILGNTLNGISLGLDRFGRELEANRHQVEALLALGATAWEAARQPVREAVRTGLVPTLNAMLIAGIVSLPGMMTGQLLAGVDPIQAVKYQLVIMFLIAAGTSLGTLGVVLLSYRMSFTSEHRLAR
jgi:putative ABC transport system permease protein